MRSTSRPEVSNVDEISRAYELAGLARLDGDSRDELRHLNRARRLEGRHPLVPASAARNAGWTWFPVEEKWMKLIGGAWTQVDTAYEAVNYRG